MSDLPLKKLHKNLKKKLDPCQRKIYPTRQQNPVRLRMRVELRILDPEEKNLEKFMMNT